ncbi:MAG: choice-of-anchor tandem repeat GloVer-containing protein [Verrucomicrobiota bacterium]
MPWLLGCQLHATPVLESIRGFVRSPEKPKAKLVQGTDGAFYGTTYGGGSSGYGTVFKMTAAGALTTLVNFNSTNGSSPEAGLVQGTDGNFYGTSRLGGSSGYGTVFKMTAAGALTTLVNFNGNNGSSPRAVLIEGSVGTFYGTTVDGGSNGYGTVYKMTAAGALTTMVNFNSTNGSSPAAGLVKGADGSFYGTTYSGGSSGYGTVFKMTAAGALTTLVNFNGTNGVFPYAGLIQGNDGNFYGTTDGAGGNGTVFKMTAAGALTTLVNFNYTNGSNPRAGLLQGGDGNFYGTTYAGGSSEDGTTFKMTAAGVLTTLVNFNDALGRLPYAELIQGTDGNFYGTTYVGGSNLRGTVFKMTSSGTLTTLTNFHSINGDHPSAGLIQSSDGNLYGTVRLGGSGGGGKVFKITTAGAFTTLVNFNSTNGSNPSAKLVEGSDGSFYGTTDYGGSSSAGTVFKVTAAGALTTLVNFNDTNGSRPEARLIQGTDGNFWGTTVYGGSSGYGTVFKMTTAGALTTLVNFHGYDASYPHAGLIQGTDGNFYGTTASGGTDSYGTVFKMTAAGALTTLVNFNYTNGGYPDAGLIRGTDGNFYGTTSFGGTGGDGTVFKMTPAGAHTILVHFNGTNGGSPKAGLMQGTDGNFYGTTYSGGTGDVGTVFKMTPAGALTTLVHFNRTNGSYPEAELIQGSDGNLYGTSSDGGSTPAGESAGGGEIFRVRLGPTVTSQAATNLTATNPTLNGTVNPGGYSTPVSFQYGTSPTLATFTTISAGTLPVGTADMAVSASPAGLSPVTTYYFRVVASNSENVVPKYGSILSFTTLQSPDIVVEAPTGTAVANGAGTLSFGTVNSGSSATRNVTIRNSGGAALSGITLSKTGTGVSQFTFAPQSFAPLAANSSVVFTVTFGPQFSGAGPATLAITSNDPDESYFTVNLSGTGNFAPTDLALSASSLAENVAANTNVGTLGSTDASGNTFTYSLVAGTGSTDNAAFTITGTAFKINTSPNFETKSSYAIRVRTTDQGGLFFEKALTIAVTNVNETPSNITLGTSTLAENVAANTTVGTLGTTDPDAANTFTYTLVSGTGSTDNTAFAITGTTLKINASPDFEVKNSYAIRVRTTDQGGLFFEKTLAVSITNVNETPTDVALNNSTLPENVAENTTLGTLGSTDPDAANTFTYSLVTGTGSTDNTAFTLTGTTLKINSSPNFEVKNSYAIRVRTTDQGTLAFEKALTISVTDVNETPTEVTLTSSSLAENIAADTTVGTLGSTDPDASNTFTYSLVTGIGSTDNDVFTITGTTLEINVSPDFESKNSYAIRLRTADQVGLFFEQTFTLTIINENEVPVIQLPGSPVIAEATSAGGAVVTFSVSGNDPEQGSITGSGSPVSGSTFPIGDTTVNASVTDADSLTATGSFIVRVRDTTAPVVSSPADVTVAATNGTGAAVTYSAATATDAVGVTSLTYSHESGTDFPIGQTVVTVTAKDAADNTGIGTFTVTVLVVNHAPGFTLPTAAFSVAEGSGAFSSSGFATGISAGPPHEASQTVAFTVTNNDNTLFAIQPTIDPAGTLTFTPGTNLGTATVTVIASDDGGTFDGGVDTSTPQTFAITILDATPPVITPLANVDSVEATGPDGAVVTYPAAQAVDNSGAVPAITYSKASGSVFPIGTTTVTVTATDAAENSSISTFGVAVVDTTAPLAEAPLGGFAPLSLTAGPGGLAELPDYTSDLLTSDLVGVTAVTQSPPAGTMLPAGTTSVSLVARDAAGNDSAAVGFDVAVANAAFENGSFEINGGRDTSIIAGWNLANGGGLVARDGEGCTDGSFSAAFNVANTPGGGVLSQTFATQTGRSYTVVFDFGAFSVPTGGTSLSQLKVEVRDGESAVSGNPTILAGSGRITGTTGGALVSNETTIQVKDQSGTSAVTGAAPNAQFSVVSFTFTAQGPLSTIVFTDQSTGGVDNQDALMDHVRIEALGDDATLSGLVLSSGALDPVFSSGTTAYTASTSGSSVTVTPTLTHASATVKVNNVPVASATASTDIPLNLGTNTISTVVTAEDGNAAQTYIVTITRTSLSYANWASGANLNGDDASSTAMPYHDGISNLIKYAFNMNGNGPDVGVLAADGVSGLPRISTDPSGAQRILQIEYVRRIGSDLIYTPQISTDLSTFTALIGIQTVTPIDTQWERVSVDQVVAPGEGHVFGRVQVILSE